MNYREKFASSFLQQQNLLFRFLQLISLRVLYSKITFCHAQLTILITRLINLKRYFLTKINEIFTMQWCSFKSILKWVCFEGNVNSFRSKNITRIHVNFCFRSKILPTFLNIARTDYCVCVCGQMINLIISRDRLWLFSRMQTRKSNVRVLFVFVFVSN